MGLFECSKCEYVGRTLGGLGRHVCEQAEDQIPEEDLLEVNASTDAQEVAINNLSFLSMTFSATTKTYFLPLMETI